MAIYPQSRSEFFRLASDRLRENVEVIEETGKAKRNHLKVFWIEANSEYEPGPRPSDGWKKGSRDFFVLPDPDEGAHTWIDIADDRIWYVYTFGGRSEVGRILKKTLLDQRGVDNVWLTESFLDYLRKEVGYRFRGFGVKYEDILEPDEYERGKFSAKFWTGHRMSEKHKQFLKSASDIFSKTSIRLGRPSSNPGRSASGALMEVFSEGSMTVTSAEDPDEVFNLVRKVGTAYSKELHELEEERLESPRPVELRFEGKPLDTEAFREMVESGVGNTKLWLRCTEKDGDLYRFTGTDLHTRELIDLDIAPEYGYLGVRKGGCMNAAPRLMTVTAQWLTGKTQIFYDGREVFA